MERSRSLEDRLDSQAEGWRPEPGDRLIGTVIDVDSRTTEFGTYPVVTILNDDGGETAIHAFHTVLKNEFAKRRPRPGERLGVKYLGKQEAGYEGYRVAWQAVAPPDWDRIGAEAEAEAAVAGIEPSSDDDIPF